MWIIDKIGSSKCMRKLGCGGELGCGNYSGPFITKTVWVRCFQEMWMNVNHFVLSSKCAARVKCAGRSNHLLQLRDVVFPFLRQCLDANNYLLNGKRTFLFWFHNVHKMEGHILGKQKPYITTITQDIYYIVSFRVKK